MCIYIFFKKIIVFFITFFVKKNFIFFSHAGLKFVRNKAEIYIRELKEEFSKGLILPTDKQKAQVLIKEKSNIDKKSFQNQVNKKN